MPLLSAHVDALLLHMCRRTMLPSFLSVLHSMYFDAVVPDFFHVFLAL